MNAYPSSFLKRLLDILISILVLPIALVLIFFGGVLILITTAGPVFYSQKRVGKNGSEFTILTLRTLIKWAEGDLAGMTKNDPNIF